MRKRVDVIGNCSHCRRVILSTDGAWASLAERTIVRGRIGAPSDEITGKTLGTKVFRCEDCLRSIGPLR